MKNRSFSELAVFRSIVVDSQRFLTQHELTSTSGHGFSMLFGRSYQDLHLACNVRPRLSSQHWGGEPQHVANSKLLRFCFQDFQLCQNGGLLCLFRFCSRWYNQYSCFICRNYIMHVFFQEMFSRYFGFVDDERVLTWQRTKCWISTHSSAWDRVTNGTGWKLPTSIWDERSTCQLKMTNLVLGKLPVAIQKLEYHFRFVVVSSRTCVGCSMKTSHLFQVIWPLRESIQVLHLKKPMETLFCYSFFPRFLAMWKRKTLLFLDSSSHDILRQAAVNSSDASVPWLGKNVDSFFAWVMNGLNMYCIYRS